MGNNPYSQLYKEMVKALEERDVLTKWEVLKTILRSFDVVDEEVMRSPVHQLAMRGMIDAFAEIAMYDDLESDKAAYDAMQAYLQDESENQSLLKDMLDMFMAEHSAPEDIEAKRDKAIKDALEIEDIDNETAAGVLLYIRQLGLHHLENYEEDITSFGTQLPKPIAMLLMLDKDLAKKAAAHNDTLARRMLMHDSVAEELDDFNELPEKKVLSLHKVIV